MESHVHGLQCLGENFVGEESVGSGIICLHRGPRLWVAEFFEGFAHGYGHFCIDEEGTKFGLHCGVH